MRSARLSPLGRLWLQHTAKLSDKTHSYTVPKLFLYELLPDVSRALTLDADVVALSDVGRLVDEATAHARVRNVCG